MRKPLVLIAAVTLVGGFATQTSAQDRIPPPIVVATGSCPANYAELLRVSGTVVCRTTAPLPRVRPTTTGCAAGETKVLVEDQYGVCLS